MFRASTRVLNKCGDLKSVLLVRIQERNKKIEELEARFTKLEDNSAWNILMGGWPECLLPF